MKAVNISNAELKAADRAYTDTRKACNINNVKRNIMSAIKDAGMEVSAVLAKAQANGRARLTDDQINAALVGKGWATDGDAAGSMMRCGDGSYAVLTDMVAARDLVEWMIGK